MLGLTFTSMKWILVVMTAISWGVPFFLTFYIIADVPSSQVQSVWKRSFYSEKKPIIDISTILGKDNEANLEKKEIERDKYRVFCSRLGLRTNYDELESKGTRNMITVCSVGVVGLVMGIIIDKPLFVLMSLALMGAGIYLKFEPFISIESKIKKLDRAIVFEAPIFIDNVRVIKTKITLEKMLENYLEHAGAMRQDVILTLASLKNKTNVRALIDMANRMQRGQRLEEVASMVDLMKSLYGGTDVDRCCINLELLANQINELHVKPYIDSQKDKKLMVMQLAVAVSVILVFLMYSSPMIIEMAMISRDLNM